MNFEKIMEFIFIAEANNDKKENQMDIFNYIVTQIKLII